MGMHQSAARFTERDIADLDMASNRLAAAAQAVRRANPVWGEAVVTLLIEANAVMVRLHDKGAEAFARYIAKHGPRKAQDEPKSGATYDCPTCGTNVPPDGAEG